MLTEAVTDGSQAMRDPVGGSVEFHFVPILKLISTLLIMGIFNDEDTMHILKMIDPSVFGAKKEEEEEGEEEGEAKEEKEEAKEEEETAPIEELEDEGVGEEEEEEDELKDLDKEEGLDEEHDKAEEEGDKGEKVDREKAEEEKEVEETGEAEEKEEEECPEEGLLQMKLPESVKLQVYLLHYRLNGFFTAAVCDWGCVYQLFIAALLPVM